jgi:hypothetical protein
MAVNTGDRHRLIGGSLLLLTIAVLLYYYFVWPVSNVIRLPLAEDCALHMQPCSAPLPMGGRMTFAINPRQPNPDEAFQLRADFEGLEPRSVGARFKGINMNMGQLEYYVHKLSRQDTLDGSISFAGSGGVFVCSIGTMQWLVLVNLQIGERNYEVPFRFETTYLGN